MNKNGKELLLLFTRGSAIMPKTYSMTPFLSILSLSYLSLGISIPAMSLIIISKGYPLFYLSLALLCYSVSVITLEVPSGIFCDAKGRKLSYQGGLFFSLVGVLLLLSSHLLFLCLGFILTGVGRAFTSGSLDALFIESHLKDERKLEDALVGMEIVSSLSLALGSFIGGFLLTLAENGPHLTDYVIYVRGVLLVFAFCLTSIGIKDDTQKKTGPSLRFKGQAKLLKDSVKGNRFLQIYVLFILIQGIQLASLESYWQPYLKELLQSDSKLWILGLVGGSVFAFSILGSLLGKFFLGKVRNGQLFLCCFVCAFVLEGILALTKKPSPFIVVYCLIYVVLGVVSVVGGYMVNLSVDSSVRSSVLSLNSFSLQSGGLLANLLAMLILFFGNITLFWIVTAGIGILAVVILAKPLSKTAPHP